MPSGVQNSKTGAVAVILGFVALVGAPILLFQGGGLNDHELVDTQENVVGREYVSGSSSLADRYREAAQLLAAGEDAHAVQVYRQLVEAEPNPPDGYIGLASAQLRQFDLTEARKNYATALQLDHSNPHALYGAGAVERMAGHPQEAKAFYEKALSESPDHLLSLYGMAHVCNQLGQGELAKKHAQHYLELAAESSLAQEMKEILDRSVAGDTP